jgi:hypothetical protein
MPNGGSDCCGNCSFNRAVQELGSPHRLGEPERQRFWDASFCTLRSVRVGNPYWTYCANFTHGLAPAALPPLKGPVFASGLYEGYVRIPWDGDREPRVGRAAVCEVCGLTTDRSIELPSAGGAALAFCTNRHYVQWWRTRYDDPRIQPEDYSP